jgi:hypothetical protein
MRILKSSPQIYLILITGITFKTKNMITILVITLFIIPLFLFVSMILIDLYIVSDLQDTYKFKKWWRRNIIGVGEGYGDLW